MILTADQKRICCYVAEHQPTTRNDIMHGAAGEGYRFLTQDLLADLDVLEAAGKITCQLNVCGSGIRLAN